MERISSNEKKRTLIARFQAEQKIRQFFLDQGYLEIRTPLLVQSPGMEVDIWPIQIRHPENPAARIFLPTSPEFSIKKILGLGIPKVFQFAPSFRHEPESPEHSPEFTMLEFYESGTSLNDFQNRIEQLFHTIIPAPIQFRGQTVEFKPNWPRFRIPDLFQTHLNLDLRVCGNRELLAKACSQHSITVSEDDTWNDLYFKLWLNLIEPKLPKNRPCFVTHYPLSQSSLCQPILDETGYPWANRFEIYVGCFELGNAFDELTDPKVQRMNFLKDQEERKARYGNLRPESPIDEDLIDALGHLKQTCGIAIGLDRLLMLALEIPHIDQLLPLKSYWPSVAKSD